MEESKEYSKITLELLERTSIISKSIMSSMTIGDTSILKGITIFEEILRDINPNKVDDNTYIYFNDIIKKYLSDKPLLNNYVYYGIDKCMMMLYSYILVKDKEKVKKLK